jgi:uncharacterized protein YbcI
MEAGIDTGAAATPAETRAQPHDQLARLCGRVAAVYRRVWGRGPVKSTAHWAGADTLVVLLQDGHTESEKTLLACGRAEQLLAGRGALHSVIEDELRATVEQVVGRPVEAVLSANRLDPDVSAHLFMLAPNNGERTVITRAERAAARAIELSDDTRALEAEQRQVRRTIEDRRRRLSE